MQDLLWLKSHVDEGTIEGGLKRVNRLEWNVSVDFEQGWWLVRAGEDGIFRSDNRESVEAFLYGLSLAYAVLPDALFVPLEEGVRRL